MKADYTEPVNTVMISSGPPVDRESEIARFREILTYVEKSSRRLAVTPILEWHGGPGIGKTTLVKLLTRECERRRIPWTLIDFKTSPTQEYVADPTALLLRVLRDLFDRVDTEISMAGLEDEVERFRATPPPAQVIRTYTEMSPDERLYQRPEWLERLRSVVIEFVDLVNILGETQRSRTRPVVLFFDETEIADIDLADWIEEWVISPLVQLRHVLVVWTARRPWRWRRPEIRRRLESNELTVFAEEEVQQQFQSSGSPPDLVQALFRKVHAMTGGHPYANNVVISEVRQWAGQVTPDLFTERETHLLGAIFDRFIRGYALKGLESDLQVACQLMALVRIFDTTMLRRVLQTSSEDLFGRCGQECFGDLLLALKSTQLIVWNKGYTLDPSLRHLIQEYYAACEPDTYRQVNEIALGVYKEWLARPVDNRALFIIEAIYHQAHLVRAGESAALELLLDEQLREYKQRINDSQALRNALELLAGELERDNELVRLVGGTLTTCLVDQIRRFLDIVIGCGG